MYKVASDLAQRRARQLWLADLQKDGFVTLTLEQQRDNLVAKLKSVEKQLLKHEPKSEWRLALGQIKLELQEQIRAIRPKVKALNRAAVAPHFIDLCRERMTKAMFCAYMREATKRAESAGSPFPASVAQEPK